MPWILDAWRLSRFLASSLPSSVDAPCLLAPCAIVNTSTKCRPAGVTETVWPPPASHWPVTRHYQQTQGGRFFVSSTLVHPIFASQPFHHRSTGSSGLPAMWRELCCAIPRNTCRRSAARATSQEGGTSCWRSHVTRLPVLDIKGLSC